MSTPKTLLQRGLSGLGGLNRLGGLQRADRLTQLTCGGWAGVSLLLFGLCGQGGLGFSLGLGPSLDWFPMVASLLKLGAFLIAAVLCWRNAIAPDSLSGRHVWQAIALGITSFVLGDITAILWRSIWGITSPTSLGDVFYGAGYFFLAVGLSQAVFSRQISLSGKQSAGIAITGILGIMLAVWLNFYLPSPAVTSETPHFQNVPAVSLEVRGAAAGAVLVPIPPLPPLVQLIDQRLSKISRRLNLLYVAGDCVLVLMATTLLMAFWGGTYSEAWQLMALAGLCLYVADMLLIYQTGQGNYQKGEFWEILWVLSALFFGLGASVEYGVVTQLRQRRPQRQYL